MSTWLLYTKLGEDNIHLITVKMTAVVLLCVVFLLSVREVISECPPSSGKTLDVYNNNCIGFNRYLPDA